MAASLMQSPGWLTAGWVMLHFLWIGTALGLLGAACRWILPARSQHRYALAVGFFAVLAASPVAILICLPGHPVDPSPVAPLPMPMASENPGPAELVHPMAGGAVEATGPMSWFGISFIIGCLPWLWLIGAPCTFLVLANGLIGSERLRRQSLPLEEGDILTRCRHLAESLGIVRHVALAVSARLRFPILVGIWKPLILLPPAALTGWTIEQLEMVLLHELAHVRRWDCLVNLLQRTVEALLFFHPMTWWLSAWVRLEREICCDRAVIARTGKPRAYAETLAAMAMRGPLRTGALAIAEHGLVTRIRCILDLEDRSMRISTKSLVFGAVFVVAAVAVLGLYAREAPREPDGAAENEVLPTKRAGDKTDTPAKAGAALSSAIAELPPGTLPPVVLPVDQSSAGAKKPQSALSFRGQVQAFEQVDLHARVSGFVEKVSVDIGDRVKKGQVLAELAVPELDAELRQREAQVLQAKAGINQVHGSANAARAALVSVKIQVQEAEGNLKSAQANDRYRTSQLQRMNNLFAAKSVEQQLVDEARERYEAAKSALNGAEAKLQAAKANVEASVAKIAKVDADLKVAQAGLLVAEAGAERVQVLRQFATIRAPFDGLVMRRTVYPGSFAPAAANTPGPPLLSVARTDVVRIVFQITESKLSQISIGDPMTVHIDALPGIEFKAKVFRLARALDPQSRTLRAEIDLPNRDGKLLAGMTATVASDEMKLRPAASKP
jgi:multidrug resistance efflux pump/beta-lactamase regulating signal transducer with metallopeptidase domain